MTTRKEHLRDCFDDADFLLPVLWPLVRGYSSKFSTTDSKAWSPKRLNPGTPSAMKRHSRASSVGSSDVGSASNPDARVDTTRPTADGRVLHGQTAAVASRTSRTRVVREYTLCALPPLGNTVLTR